MPELYSVAYLQRGAQLKQSHGPALCFEPVSWPFQTHVSLPQTENEYYLPFEWAKGALSLISLSLPRDTVLSNGDEWNTASDFTGSLYPSNKINGRTQTTQQRGKTIMSGNITSRSISASAEVSLCPHLPTSHFFLCLLLANGLPPCRGKRGSCQGISAFIILYPSLTQALKPPRFCRASTLAAGANQRIQGQHFLFLIWQTRSGTSLNDPVPIAVKNKETKKGRFFQKHPVVRHKVGLSFQLLLWERKVLRIPGFALSEVGGKRIWGERLFCLPLLPALKGQSQNSVPQGIRASLPSRFMALGAKSCH